MDTGPIQTGSATLTALPANLGRSTTRTNPVPPRAHYARIPRQQQAFAQAGPIREAARLRRFFAGWSLAWSVAASFALLLLFWVLS